MEPIDETLLPLTSLISDLFGTNKHHRFDGNFSKISVVMTDAVERYRLRNLQKNYKLTHLHKIRYPKHRQFLQYVLCE